MRIGIDARLFGPRQGGLGRYLEQLIKHLEQLETEAEFVIFLRKDNWDEYSPANKRFTKVLADIPWYGWREQLLFPRLLKKHKLDLVHFPHWNVPLLFRGKYIVTIHDLILLHFPDRSASTHSALWYSFKYKLFKKVLANAVKHANHIITISEFSKRDIVSTLKTPAEKITVTYLAPRTFPRSSASFDQRIQRPYALYVGVSFPHKNLPQLLAAWSKFNEHHNGSYQLVLCGKRNYFYDRLLSEHKRSFESGSVVFTDFASDETLAALYQKAHLFVYPSFYEGFGLPPLEAMASGVPVASSNASCLPEIIGDAAIFFDPSSKTSLASALEDGFKDKELRETLIKNGFQQVEKYDWKKSAEQTFEVYKNSV